MRSEIKLLMFVNDTYSFVSATARDTMGWLGDREFELRDIYRVNALTVSDAASYTYTELSIRILSTVSLQVAFFDLANSSCFLLATRV